MRKHRLFGVVIAVALGLGAFTQHSGPTHPSAGRDSTGVQLTTAELSADRVSVPVAPTAVAGTAHATHDALLDLVAGHAEVILSSPFGPQALVADTDIAQMNERAVASAYLSALAVHQAMAKASLESVAPPPPPPAPVTRAVRVVAASTLHDPWPALRQCESNGNYGEDSGNGYYGAYQFNIGTWRSLGLGGLPSQASAAEQDQAAQELQARRGWGQWPSCARRLGLL
jgi:hypothetical protein